MRTLVALVLAALPGAAAAQWTFDAEAAWSYDDNLSNAQRESDITRDHAAALRGALGRWFVFADGDLQLRGEARGSRHDTFSGLDQLALGLAATWQRKLGVGLTAPRLVAEAALFEEQYDEPVRDGTRAAFLLELGKRFGPRFEAALGWAYDWRRARDEAGPFSLQGRSVTVKADFAVTEALLAFGALAARRGDVVSSTRRNRQIFDQSAAVADDPAFGPDFIAYKLTGAATSVYTVGLSWALGRRASLNAAMSTDRTSAGDGLDYDGNVYSVSLVYRN